MKYRRLGGSGLKVSEISLGSWMTFGGYVKNEQSIRTIHRTYELGVNFFDTANEYGRGSAERVVGEALSQFSTRILCHWHESLGSDGRRPE